MITNILPTDVEQYILEFLIMPLDIKRLKKVSKIIKKYVNSQPYIIEKNKITDRIFMMNEDILFEKNKSHFHPAILSSLANCWHKYNKWSWLVPTKDKTKDYFTIGEFIDAKDKVDVWGPAYIKDIKLEPIQDDNFETRRLYLVEFLGWTRFFDEWISIDKIENLGTKTFSPLLEFDSIKRNEHHWVLYNDPLLGWKIVICRMKYENQDKSISLEIERFNNRSHKQTIFVSKQNINLFLKPISNISVFLCDTSKFLYLENKKILM
tara:strand:+ start:157 stop:951 length:795 start_codon:yes stop_codon:yes gene_type:complete